MASMTMAEFIAKARTGRFFRVRFVKRTTREERDMLARTGVTKGTVGGSLGYSPSEKHLLSVYDMRAHGFRMVNLEEPLYAKIGGHEYTWDRHKQLFVENDR